MVALLQQLPACLFAASLAYAVYAALDFGRRWVAMKDRSKEALDAVQVCQRAIEKLAQAKRELEERTIALEEKARADEVAGGRSMRPRRPIPMGM